MNNETCPRVKSVCEPAPKSPPVHQDLSLCHGWRFKNAILRLANVGERKFETHSLSPLGVRTTEDLGAASQTLLAGG